MRTATELKQMYNTIKTDAVNTIGALVNLTPDKFVDISRGNRLVIQEYNDQESETLDEVFFDADGVLTATGRFYDNENSYDISSLDIDTILAILEKVEKSI